MYNTSQKWKENIYKNVQCAMNIYIDDVLVNPDYILDFKKGGDVFDEEFVLGNTPSQYIEVQIYKEQVLKPKTIRVEYGILINNALTVEEVNSMLVGTLNGIPVKSLSSNDSSFEMIPLGTYNVDDYTDNDDGTLTIKALDNMIKFEFNYDGSELVNKKGYATLLEVAQDICNKAGVELSSTSFLNSEKQIAVYDNTVTAREYISYIAESSGCFAVIGRDGKLYFKHIYADETEISLDIFGEYKWGEEFQISKVSYEDGVRSFKFGDETRNNLWIDQENMYIVDEEQVERIYNQIGGLMANSFEGKTIIDPALDIGDKIIIDGKPIIYQGELTLEGRFIAQINSKIQIKQKEETTVKKESQKVINRRVQSEINQIDGKITQLVEETTEHTEKLSQVEQDIDSINQKVEIVEDLIRTVKGIKKASIEDAYENENILELHIYGNNRVFDYLYPQDDLYPSDTLYPYGDSRIRFKNNNEEKIIELGIDEVLRANDEVKDELIIVGTEVSLIRRVNADGTTKENEEKTYLGNLKFILTKGINEFEILNYYAEIEVKYAIKSTYTDIFATKIEMNSEISQTATEITEKVKTNYATKDELITEKSERIQTATEITQEVSKKVGEDEIISKINQSAETISIEADKININGTVSANGNFKILKDGSMEAYNGKFTGGNINLIGGTEDSTNFNVKSESNNVKVSIAPDHIWIDGQNSETVGISLRYSPNTNNNAISLRSESAGAYLSVGNGSASNFFSADGINKTVGVWGPIYANSFNNNSSVDLKKNIVKFSDNVLEKIKKADLYEFNYKEEKDTDKKHIGFVIGENYNTPIEIIAKNGEGIDTYSMTSILWKAVQEQQEIIEELQLKIEKMEGK